MKIYSIIYLPRNTKKTIKYVFDYAIKYVHHYYSYKLFIYK